MLADPADVREVFSARPRPACNAGDANEILRPMLGPSSVLLLDGAEHLHQRKLMLPAFHGERHAALPRDHARGDRARDRGLARAASRSRCARTRRRSRSRSSCAPCSACTAPRRWAACARRCSAWSTGRPTRADGDVRRRSAPTPVVRRLRRRDLAPIDRELYALIAERRAAPDVAERDDVLSMLLLARDEDGAPMTDVELRDELMTLLVAGHETTANSLAWAFERLARQPGGLAARRRRRRLRRGGGQGDAAPAPGRRARRCAGCSSRRGRRPRAARGDGRDAVHPAGAPPARRLPRARGVPPRALPRAPRRAPTPGSRSAAACAAASGAAFAQIEMQVVLQTIAESRRAASRRRRRARAPARHHARPGARRAVRARSRRRVAVRSAAVADLYLQRDQPPGVPPLALDGERTLPDVPEENYWFRRHLAVYEWIARAGRRPARRRPRLRRGLRLGRARARARRSSGSTPTPTPTSTRACATARPTCASRATWSSASASRATRSSSCRRSSTSTTPAPSSSTSARCSAAAARRTCRRRTSSRWRPQGAERSGNPWHLREYRAAEFRALCEAHFGRSRSTASSTRASCAPTSSR